MTKMNPPKAKIGDRVVIVNYGHPIWVANELVDKFPSLPIIGEQDGITFLDMEPSIVGKSGIIEKVSETQGKWQYAIGGIPQKHAWYSEEQIEVTPDSSASAR